MGDLLGSPRVAPLFFVFPLSRCSLSLVFALSWPMGSGPDRADFFQTLFVPLTVGAVTWACVRIRRKGTAFQVETAHRARLVATPRARSFFSQITSLGAPKLALFCFFDQSLLILFGERSSQSLGPLVCRPRLMFAACGFLFLVLYRVRTAFPPRRTCHREHLT